jgi:hypothetical protein
MIFKTKKSSVIILAIVCLVTVSIILGGGIFFYISKKKNSVNDNIPPIIQEMITLNEDVKKTTIDIYKLSGKLAGISAAHSRIGDIESAIELIGSLRLLVENNQSAIDRLLQFIEGHADFVHRKNLLWVFSIKKFYMDHNVMQHHKSREKYLSAFETHLKYTFTNFQNIMELQSPQHMQSYHTYYMRWRRAADSHNKFNKKRIKFQIAFVEKNPEVSRFLPGAHQRGEFKFWDKFSF